MTRIDRTIGAAGVLLALLALGCSAEEPTGDLLHIRDDQFAVGDLSKDRAWATGIGCSGSEREAVENAQHIAEFNLRGLTGAARYRVEYRVLRRFTRPGQACVEMEAKAVPLRTR